MRLCPNFSNRSAIYFNPRTPRGVRLELVAVLLLPQKFQSTHPSRGATMPLSDGYDVVQISIHAPLAGCDCLRSEYRVFVIHFNPRTPRGVRRMMTAVSRVCWKFQSTHPSRGATVQIRLFTNFIPISIHAPLAGCDVVSIRGNFFTLISIHAPLAGCDGGRAANACRYRNFNPRTPCGVRPSTSSADVSFSTFQSTHPLRGATPSISINIFSSEISIHAPLAGCDAFGDAAVASKNHFNPRTPCGVRPQRPYGLRFQIIISIHAPLAGRDLAVSRFKLHAARFQSTHPLRGATGWVEILSARTRISIHAPLAGCDGYCPPRRAPFANFNPRTPCGVRRALRPAPCAVRQISINAPLAGCDPAYRAARFAGRDFNPRTPCGVRLTNRQFTQLTNRISIHAPLAGCDGKHARQSPRDENFNPRTPCGVRLKLDNSHAAPRGFQSTHPLRGAT